MARQRASGPLVTTIFIVVSLATVLIAIVEVRAWMGVWWYTAIVTALIAVTIVVAVYLMRAVNGGTA